MHPILPLFKYGHLPTKLQDVSRLFHDVAWQVAALPKDEAGQRDAALQRLLEAKDAAVRAKLEADIVS